MRNPQALLQQMVEKLWPKARAPMAETGSLMRHLVLKVQLPG